MEKRRQKRGGIVHELWRGPSRGHSNRYCDEITISLSGHLEIPVGVDTNIYGGEGLALHLQDLLYILEDSITKAGSHAGVDGLYEGGAVFVVQHLLEP